MNKKRIAILSLSVLLGTTALVAVGSPFGWFSKAPLVWSGTDIDDKISFEIAGWPDGSAEALIAPLHDLPANEMPAGGFVRINNKIFKFGERKGEDDKMVLAASVPVGVIPLSATLDFEMVVLDQDGQKMLVRTFSYKHAE